MRRPRCTGNECHLLRGPCDAGATAHCSGETATRQGGACGPGGSSRQATAARKTGAGASDPAATLLTVAQAKYDTRLYDQALADLRTITTTHAASPSAAAAYLLMGQIHEQQARPEDAMAAYVELRSRHPGNDAEAEATFRLAQLTARARRPDRVNGRA